MNQGTRNSIASEPVKAQVEKASFLQRLFAYMIDWIILGLVEGCLGLVGGFGQQSRGWLAVAWGIIQTAIPAIYFVWSYSISGETVGKRALKIKVVSIDGSPLNWRKGILRSIGYLISELPFSLGFLWSLWDADKQAWHDKIAGTCVVPVSVEPEQLAGTIEPSEAWRRQRRWLLGLGIPSLVISMALIGGFLFFARKGVEEVRGMEPWPGPEVSPETLVMVDLSHLGLEAGPAQNARDENTWAGGGYEDGVLITYHSGSQDVVAVWALRYGDAQTASADYQSVQAAAAEPANCGLSSYAYIGNSGVIHCQFGDGYQKLFWNDHWIVSVVALEGIVSTPDVLVDQVRDALAAHWKTIAQPSQ